ncbi:penicillin acylase family protein, partial [Acetobacter senegalensis]|uniref:penicillin acylase family protein n=1 Tax=Acetobacter senegalensis TaxID=446692 RepID=UPI0020A00C92
VIRSKGHTPQVRNIARFLPDTPGTLAVTNPVVRQALLDTLGAAAQKLQSLHFPLSVPLAAVQYRETPRGKVAVPGGREFEGTLNIAGFGALAADGYGHADIVGTSYLQVVSWKKGLPEARAILTYGQSGEINLPEYDDQTELYARSQLLRQPFDQPAISTQHLQVPSH